MSPNLPLRPIPSVLLLIQPLDFNFYIILPVPNIIMTVDFLFLPKAALHLSALEAAFVKTSNPPSDDKKNSCTAWRLCTNDALSLVFLQPITARLFPINSHSVFCALHFDDSSWRVSDVKLRRCEHFNQRCKHLIKVLYHQSTFQIFRLKVECQCGFYEFVFSFTNFVLMMWKI